MTNCDQPTCEEARRRVMQHGRTAAAYAILNPGILHWFDDRCDAVAGFVRRGPWWVVAGDPVCDAADMAAVCDGLERDAAAEGRRVVYVCCTDVMRAALPSHATITMGAEPVWRPNGWAGRVKTIRSLRAQLSRARNKGVTIELIDAAALNVSRADRPCAAQRDMGGTVVPGSKSRLRQELGMLIDDWLAHRPLPPLSFLVEPLAVDGVMTDRRIWIARQHGRPVAFLLASPVPRRGGWIVEQICRRRDAPNGTSELLIDAAMRQWAGEGCDYATLGLVILTPLAGAPHKLPPLWLRAIFGFARIHGRRFYNFDGLERFRVKMVPDAWEPMHIVMNSAAPSLAGLYFAGAAFCGRRSPASVVAEGAIKALAIDGRKFWRGLFH